MAGRMMRVLGVPGRLLGALFVPDRVVPRVVDEGRYGLALVVVMAAALLAAGAIGLRVDMSRVVLMQSAAGPPGAGPGGAGAAQMEEKSDREIDEEIAKLTAIVRVKLGLSAGIGTPFGIFMLAFGLYLLSRYVGGKPTMRRTMAVAAHASLPGAIKALVAAGAAWKASSLQPQEMEQLVNGGALEPKHLVLARFAAGVDVFMLWSLLILGFGVAAASGMSRKKSFVTVLVGFFLYQLVTRFIMGGGAEPPPGPGAR